MPNSFQKVDILSSNITSIIPSHDLARILEMLSQSIKIIKSWNNTCKFVKKNIDEWIQRSIENKNINTIYSEIVSQLARRHTSTSSDHSYQYSPYINRFGAKII